MKVAYPTQIKNVITALTKSTQKALQNRKSRIEIELPPGVEFGVESDGKRTKGKRNISDKVKNSNREASRLLTDMFAIIGGTTVVLFPSEAEASEARSIWGSKFKGQVLSIDVPAPKGYGKLRSRRFSAQEQEAALMASDGIFVPEETEVLIIAGPRAKDLKKIKKISEKFGDGTLIILLNGRTRAMVDSTANRNSISTATGGEDVNVDDISEDAQTVSLTDWIESTFENAFNYAPPVLSGALDELDKKDLLLFHEFKGKWYLAERDTDGDNDGGNAGMMGSINSMATRVGKAVGAVSAFNTIWEGDERPWDQDVQEAVGAAPLGADQ